MGRGGLLPPARTVAAVRLPTRAHVPRYFLCSQIGASAVYVEDLREDFLKSYILPSIQCNAIYENLYLMGTSLGEPARVGN